MEAFPSSPIVVNLSMLVPLPSFTPFLRQVAFASLPRHLHLFVVLHLGLVRILNLPSHLISLSSSLVLSAAFRSLRPSHSLTRSSYLHFAMFLYTCVLPTDPSSPQLLTKLHHLTSNRNVRRPSLSLSPSASSFISTATSSMPSRPSLSSSSSLRPPLIPSPSSPSLRKLTDELSTVLHPLPPSPSSSSIERTSQLTSPPPDPSFCLFLPDRHDGRVRGLALPPPPRSELLPAYLSFILPPSRMRACFPSTTTFSTSSLPDSEDPTLYHDPLVSSIDDVRDTATFLTQQNEDSSVDNPLPSPSSPLDCSREVVSSSPALCLSTSLLKPSALPRSRSSAVETLFPLCKDPQACRTWPELTEHQKQRQMIRSSGASLLLAAFDGDEDSVIVRPSTH